MWRFIGGVRKWDLAFAFGVFTMVVVLGLASEARADFVSENCDSVPFGGTKWICNPGASDSPCREDIRCVGVILLINGIDKEWKIAKAANLPECVKVDERCPGWLDFRCNSFNTGVCFGIPL